jgi:ribosomal protein L40E
MAKMIITTRETCPVCLCENIRVEHGYSDELGRLLHHEICPECGESWPIVAYNCQNCEAAKQAQHNSKVP